MRLGFADGSGAEAARIARIAQECGVDAISVHGRTREQGYAGCANYESIRRVKEAVQIPVIGNGDVVDGASARRLREVAGCDGVMLGRGALGNPWIYHEVDAALSGGEAPPRPSWAERRQVILRHITLQEQFDPWPIGPLRRIVAWYIHGLPGAAELRNQIHHAPTVEAIRDVVSGLSVAEAPSAVAPAGPAVPHRPLLAS